MENKAETVAAANPAAPEVDQRAGKYLTFRLGPEEFGVQVRRIREIMGIQEIMAAPGTPGYVKGVINLRGKVIPVMDLRLRLGLPELEYTTRTCIIVAQIDGGTAGKLPIGIIVDRVSEVLALRASDIADAPNSGGVVPARYLLGTVKIKGKVKMLLDLDSLLSAQDAQSLVFF